MNSLMKRSIMKAIEKKYNGCEKLVAHIENNCMEIHKGKDWEIEPIDKVEFNNVMIMFNLKSLHKITIDIIKNVIILHGDKEIIL